MTGPADLHLLAALPGGATGSGNPVLLILAGVFMVGVIVMLILRRRR